MEARLSGIRKSQAINFFMSYLNNLKYCFYHKPPDFIITSSVTDCVNRNQSKYKLNDMLKSKAYLHGLLGK